MKNQSTISYHGRIYEYEIDELNFVFIKDGTTLISIGQMSPLKQTEDIENVVCDMIKLVLPLKPIK